VSEFIFKQCQYFKFMPVNKCFEKIKLNNIKIKMITEKLNKN